MKKICSAALLFLFLAQTAAAAGPLEGRVIALDAGHGEGGATGAVGVCGLVEVASQISVTHGHSVAR